MNHRPFPSGVRAADAEAFVFSHGRLLERRRINGLLHGGGLGGLLTALGAYRNPDGGFGSGLEPDVRSPHSEPLSTLAALDLLASWNLPDHPWVRSALEWVASISAVDGSVPFVTESAHEWPHAPWVQSSPGGSHLTYGFAAAALLTEFEGGWAEAAADWCRWRLSRSGKADELQAQELPAYEAKYAVRFLTADGASDPTAHPVLEELSTRLRTDGALPVQGGAPEEMIHPVDLLHNPWTPAFATALADRLASEELIAQDLRWLADGQEPDGGWTVDWPAWSPAQGLEWRGLRTVEALEILAR